MRRHVGGLQVIPVGPDAPIRVVLADDHARYRDGLAAAIDAHDELELAEAVSDGALAVAAVEHHKPDVALLDVRMPGVDGLEAARRVSDSPSTSVVLLSGSTSDALEREASAVGARALLSKELSRRDICRRLTEFGRA